MDDKELGRLAQARLDREIQISLWKNRFVNTLIGVSILTLIFIMVVGVSSGILYKEDPKLHCYAGMLHNPAKQQILDQAGRGVPCDRYQVPQ